MFENISVIVVGLSAIAGGMLWLLKPGVFYKQNPLQEPFDRNHPRLSRYTSLAGAALAIVVGIVFLTSPLWSG